VKRNDVVAGRAQDVFPEQEVPETRVVVRASDVDFGRWIAVVGLRVNSNGSEDLLRFKFEEGAASGGGYYCPEISWEPLKEGVRIGQPTLIIPAAFAEQIALAVLSVSANPAELMQRALRAEKQLEELKGVLDSFLDPDDE
jgi:hypothetical protein